MNSSYKYLLKNIGLLTLSNFATKLLTFLLVPFYTNVLTTTEYGTYDLFYTTVSVLVPILTLNIQDAVTRYAIDKKFSRDAIVTTAGRYLIAGSLIIVIAVIINHIFSFSALLEEYAVFFLLMFMVQSFSGILTGYTRGIDKIIHLSISSIVVSVATIGCNILFLLIFRWGLKGYFAANIIGPLLQCIYLFLADRVWNNFHFLEKFKKEGKELSDYSKPLIANTLSWWVNNASDRYVVIFFWGYAENGIYSVASKIPAILNVVQSIFSQAWTLSAVKDFDPEDKHGFFKNMYSSYNCVMVIVCSIIISLDKVLARILYARDFYMAWRYVPWLTIAVVFGALAGYVGGIFAAAKDSQIFAKSSVVSAGTKIVLNLLMTPFMGGLGAAIATTICFVEVWVIRLWHARKYIRLKINIKRDIISYVLLLIQAAVIMMMPESLGFYLFEFAIFLFILLLYKTEILGYYKKILGGY